MDNFNSIDPYWNSGLKELKKCDIFNHRLLEYTDGKLPNHGEKCARSYICPCRVANIKCCFYCKCSGGEICKNPNNILIGEDFFNGKNIS